MVHSISPVSTVQCWTLFLLHTLQMAWNFVTGCCIVLFYTSLLQYTLLNASQTAANYLIWSNFWEWAHLLFVMPCSQQHNFHATSVSSGLLATKYSNLSVTEEVIKIYCMGVDLLMILFLCVVNDCCWLCFTWYIL
jgi:hypothetical protein